MLADIIGAGAVPVLRLTEVFRQPARAGSSPTRTGSTGVCCPSPVRHPASDFQLARCTEPEDGVAKLLAIVAKRITERSGSTRSATCRCCAR